MTRDEFLSIVDTELDRLDQEYKELKNKEAYYVEIAPYGKDLIDVRHRMKLVSSKKKAIEQLIGLPAYARIQAMSDIEIQAHKEVMISEANEEIAAVDERIIIARSEKARLSVEKDGILRRFSEFFGAEKKFAIDRAKDIEIELAKYDENNPRSLISEFIRNREELVKKLEKIRNLSNQEIIDMVASSFKNYDRIPSKVNSITSNPVSRADIALAEATEDPQKAREIAGLFTVKGRRAAGVEKIYTNFYLPIKTPFLLESKLKKETWDYDHDEKKIYHPDKVMEKVQVYKEDFEKLKVTFDTEFTVEKLRPLIRPGKTPITEELSVDFFRSHKGKVDEESLNQLERLTIKRDELKRRFIKTNKVKDEIEELSYQILQLQIKIRGWIEGWYLTQRLQMLGIEKSIEFDGYGSVDHYIESAKWDIKQTEAAIEELEQRLLRAKDNIDKVIAANQATRDEADNKVKEIAGIPDVEGPIIKYPSSNPEVNLDNLYYNAQRVAQQDLYDRVQAEAKNQADEAEAQLRGMTVEDLLELRKQLLEQQLKEESPVMDGNTPSSMSM